jgi:pimeloyl-ACP methyl ester carboxylesterase
MPALLIHGNPDSSRLWDRVKPHLDAYDGEVIAADLPGFADPAPGDFDCSKEAYVEWIAERARELGGNVDLVGHDWGSLLVQRVASIHGDLLNTVACGGAVVDPNYEWHPLAQVWQTPKEGERYMAEELTPEFGINHLLENGVPEEYAKQNIWLTDYGKDTILKLYRSAIEIGPEWGPDVERQQVPAMVIWGRTDPYVPFEFGESLARRMHAELVALDCGHWWPYERPEETAAALLRHWSR